ncbi:hypothetical protein ABHF54_06725 [Nitrosomonas europaea]|uniref:hypothetical protein n=1 Tax=Nitrosomonas europaea TaxID=915 RepID=UPI0032665F9B
MNDENRLNRGLSPFCGQQKISGMGEFKVCARFIPSFRRGLRRNGSGLLLLFPHLPPYKTGFWGWCEILVTSFSGYFFNNQLFFTS